MSCPLCTGTQRLFDHAGRLTPHLERWITPLFDLGIRLYIAEIFFRSGWLKIADWSNTMSLFTHIYQVPLLPPGLAAFMGTTGELVLPILLALGLNSRFAALGLFVVNFTAAISFPDISDLGLKDHVLWGALLLVTLLHGPGRWSLDGRASTAVKQPAAACPIRADAH